MYIEEVIPEFRNDKKIRRQCWDKKEYIYYDCMLIVQEDGSNYYFDVDDIFASDWCYY